MIHQLSFKIDLLLDAKNSNFAEVGAGTIDRSLIEFKGTPVTVSQRTLHPWCNPTQAEDVNDSGDVTALDVLIIINQPLVPLTPADGEIHIASLGTTMNERDLLVGRATRTLAPVDLDRDLAGLDAVLSDIAEDVFHGWEQGVSNG